MPALGAECSCQSGTEHRTAWLCLLCSGHFSQPSHPAQQRHAAICSFSPHGTERPPCAAYTCVCDAVVYCRDIYLAYCRDIYLSPNVVLHSTQRLFGLPQSALLLEDPQRAQDEAPAAYGQIDTCKAAAAPLGPAFGAGAARPRGTPPSPPYKGGPARAAPHGPGPTAPSRSPPRRQGAFRSQARGGAGGGGEGGGAGRSAGAARATAAAGAVYKQCPERQRRRVRAPAAPRAAALASLLPPAPPQDAGRGGGSGTGEGGLRVGFQRGPGLPLHPPSHPPSLFLLFPLTRRHLRAVWLAGPTRVRLRAPSGSAVPAPGGLRRRRKRRRKGGGQVSGLAPPLAEQQQVTSRSPGTQPRSSRPPVQVFPPVTPERGCGAREELSSFVSRDVPGRRLCSKWLVGRGGGGEGRKSLSIRSASFFLCRLPPSSEG